MSHILKEYEKNLEVKADKPVVSQHFFPILAEKYILIFHEKTAPSKQYRHYSMVLSLLKPFLKEQNILAFQIGNSEDPINGIDGLLDGLNFKQISYLIAKSQAIISCDNVYSQYASSIGVKLINIFGNVFPSITKGYWSSNLNCANIAPNWECKPSLNELDSEDAINKIKPEEIALKTIKLLNPNLGINFKTHHIGSAYYADLIDIIPTSFANLDLFKNKTLRLRLDYPFEESSFFQYLSKYPCEIILRNKVLPLNHISKLIKNIKKITVIIDDLDHEEQYLYYFKQLSELGIAFDIVVANHDVLDQARLAFFDYPISKYKPVDCRPDSIPEGCFFFCNKKVIEGSSVYSSLAHWKLGRKTLDKKEKILDNPLYWEDLEYYYIYEQK